MAKCKELRGIDLTVRDLMRLGNKGNHELRFPNVGPRHAHPWQDPHFGDETATEAAMAKAKLCGKLGLVTYNAPHHYLEIKVRMEHISESLAKELAEAGRNGNDVKLEVDIGDANKIKFKSTITGPLPKAIRRPKIWPKTDEEPMDLDSLRKQVETVGLVIKPQTSDRRGYAARAAMRVYARLMEGEDPVEADMWLSLAQHYDIVVENEKRKGKP